MLKSLEMGLRKWTWINGMDEWWIELKNAVWKNSRKKKTDACDFGFAFLFYFLYANILNLIVFIYFIIKLLNYSFKIILHLFIILYIASN